MPIPYRYKLIQKAILPSRHLEGCFIIGSNSPSSIVQVKFDDGFTAIVPRRSLKRFDTV